MTLPDGVRGQVEAALLEATGTRASIAGVSPVSGGCISPTARIRTDDGSSYFFKGDAPGLPSGLLAAEARGLAALAAADAVRVPAVVARGEDPAWLLLEWLEPGAPSPDSWSRLGSELAEQHRSHADRFGAEAPNFIGSLPQANEPAGSWPAFWRDRRLEPRLRQAERDGHLDDGDRRRFERLFDRLPELLEPAAEDGPSLLHGDLWSGNVHVMAGGTPAIIDPSVYYGHREVDLAMAELFGGFGPDFRRAYDGAWPLAPGYAPTRRAVYQLYYLLVHVNLFGSGYVSGTRRALEAAGV